MFSTPYWKSADLVATKIFAILGWLSMSIFRKIIENKRLQGVR